MHPKVFSVTELTSAIRALLEPQFRGVCVRGEISNLKIHSSGHLYFSLKDADAQISSVLFRMNATGLPRMPKEGDQVLAKGELSVYPPRGGYQLIIRELQFLGEGELLLKLHQLKEALKQRGWFDPIHKKPLPKLPRRIGVVTSPTGAVIQDILNVLTRRFSGFQVVLNPVKVQGEGAAQEIARAIDDMNRYQLADVLIVGRGGGSIEDLWPFNEEVVARAIFASTIPIISAVGHETDVTIADWVADVRAPTPSAAAEMAIAEKEALLTWLQRAHTQGKHLLVQKVRERERALSSLRKHPLLSQPQTLLAHRWMRLDELESKLDLLTRRSLQLKKVQVEALQRSFEDRKPSRQIALQRMRLANCEKRLEELIKAQLHLKRSNLNYYKSSFQAIHPQHLLKKGYSILFSEKDHSIILAASELHPDQPFTALLGSGRIRAKAVQIEEVPDGSLF